MEGLTRDDPLAGAPVFHVSLVEASKPLSPLENAQVGSGLGPFGSRAFVQVLGELNSKKATPFSRGLERASKAGLPCPCGKGVFRL